MYTTIKDLQEIFDWLNARNPTLCEELREWYLVWVREYVARGGVEATLGALLCNEPELMQPPQGYEENDTYAFIVMQLDDEGDAVAPLDGLAVDLTLQKLHQGFVIPTVGEDGYINIDDTDEILNYLAARDPELVEVIKAEMLGWGEAVLKSSGGDKAELSVFMTNNPSHISASDPEVLKDELFVLVVYSRKGKDECTPVGGLTINFTRSQLYPVSFVSGPVHATPTNAENKPTLH